LALWSLGLAAFLHRSARPLPLSRRLWVAAFFLTAVGALTGAARHALFEETSSLERHRLWSATYLVLGLANLAFLAGLLRAVPRGPWVRLALAVLCVRAAAFSALLLAAPSHGLVIADFALSLAMILALTLVLLVKRDDGGGWLLAGLAVSAAGALVQALRLGPLGIFNHNDLFHVIQMGGLWLFYRAGRRFWDAGPAPVASGGEPLDG